ncbi:MAG: hypothetical protein KJ057_13000 [Phycisphaerae bacterium]|nr:hypothetical protein [Planctomycetia bacterium]MCL4719382.1 hypothetical protein [Phycisphaerae bacterium]
MKKNAVHLGQSYLAKVSGILVPVRIDAENPHGGWTATNTETGRKVRIKSAQRLRRPAASETPASVETPNDRDVNRAPRSELSLEEADKLAKVRAARAYDPGRCATPRCKGEPALTYLGKPLCQKCWDRQCANERPSEMVTEGAVPLAGALAISPVAEANEASWERAQPGPDDVGNDDEHENAGDEPASTGDAGEVEIEDMASKTKKNVTKKGKAPKAATKAPAARKSKAAAKIEAPASRKAKAATNGDAKPKRVSALDAAAQVLRSAKESMRPREIIEAAASKGLWTSPAGKTPHATLDAAMRREIKTKGKDARFTIEGRGLFGYNGKAASA